MKTIKIVTLVLFVAGIAAVLILACSPQKAEMVRPVSNGG